MEMLTIIENLDGYLHCLRRLSDNRCDFWANTFDLSSDVKESLDAHLSDQGISIKGSSVAGYREISQALESHVFSELTILSESQKKLIEWDFIEYIEMACRSYEPELSPISSGLALLFSASSEFHGQYQYLVIPLNNQAIIIGLAVRA